MEVRVQVPSRTRDTIAVLSWARRFSHLNESTSKDYIWFDTDENFLMYER